MSDQNWRPEIDAEDYFSHQKKKLNVADRRPVIRKASDLVGPGIDGQAVRIDNFNDPLAQFNGFFSADVGPGMAAAMNAPAEGKFIGNVVSDAELGGKQTFTSLGDGKEYVRTFIRNPTDTDFVFWGSWGLAGGGGGPIGSITAFGGGAAPAGWLVCNGAAVSRTEYADLFAAIGTAYGPGNGSSTFNLPDARNRALYGAGSHWTLGGNDGLSEADRQKLLEHGHHAIVVSGEVTIPGHSHSISSGGGHAHTGSTGTGSISQMASYDGDLSGNFSRSDHTHDIATTSNGSHSHGGSTGDSGETTVSVLSMGGTWGVGDNSGEGGILRGVGVNYIIRYE